MSFFRSDLKTAFSLFGLAVLLGIASPAPAQPTVMPGSTPPLEGTLAEQIYRDFGAAIYQIQVIDIASGKKTSIGSGFEFTDDGLIATNYHVVADAIQRPKENRVEFIGNDKTQGPLEILAADVVHDLAIVRKKNGGGVHVDLGADDHPKGVKLYSLGNPHDIGFTIIEGTYNGLSDETLFDKKIHFSGSLNPGMSGGPALDRNGRVVGVNVSTAGNQISFLVPVRYLKNLADDVAATSPDRPSFMATARAVIEEQLFANQKRYIASLLENTWETVPFGAVRVPGRIHPIFKCWGRPEHAEKDPYQHHSSTCSTQDQMFLGDDFTTGPVIYRYDAFNARDGLNLARFYNLYENHYSMPLDSYDNATEADVTRFACDTRFLDLAGERWKASFCLRRYTKYPRLYDMHLYMALVGHGRQGLLISLISQGIGRESALSLMKKFLDNITPLAAAPTEKETGAAP